MSKKRLLTSLLGAGAFGAVAFLATASYLIRPEVIKRLVISGLTQHLNLEAELDDISVSFVPRPSVSGRGLRLRLPGRAGFPPFISIDHFTVDVGLLSVMRRHVDTVHADGLKITVPPRDAGQDPKTGDPSRDINSVPRVIVDHFVTHDAELRFIPRNAAKNPLVFKIHALDVHDIGFDRSLPFTARLTNPIPEGLVEARGQVGPWVTTDGLSTKVSGAYVFTDANLSTINGIGGTLQSRGQFSGQLTSIGATGTATVPDFSLDLGGRPVRLVATFDTTVDASDGTTYLNHVDATLGSTVMQVRGAIRNLEGPGRHEVEIEASVTDGRIEDVLALVIDSDSPVMTGDVVLQAKFLIPPGEARLRQRLTLDGSFGLASTRFTDKDVQNKLTELSRRSQGKDKDDAMSRVMTNLKGKVRLRSGVASLTGLTFQVPGALIGLDGTYGLADEALDFRGTLRMKATVSKAIGGLKSIFIKPFDPLFRKNGAGAELPIKIQGTRKAPKFGLEMGKIFGSDKKN